MITASFNHRNNDSAAVTGAYQYDTGQRVRLVGLPSPDDLAKKDDFLSGDQVTVECQFAFQGDSQTESRLAQWDDDKEAWIANVPDVYLQRYEEVHFYVLVFYGSTEDDGIRRKTMYEAVFTPQYRPAPSDTVTPAQQDAWAALVGQVNEALLTIRTATDNANSKAQLAQEAAENAGSTSAAAVAAANTATANANTATANANTATANTNAAIANAQTATENANTATGNANTATGNANAAAASANTAAANANAAASDVRDTFDSMTATATQLASNQQPTVTVSVDTVNKTSSLAFGIPQGATGPQGPTGATGPAGVIFTLSGTTLTITLDPNHL